MRSHPFYRTLYGQVLIATAVGVLLGHFYPETGSAMKPLGDGFIKLVKNDHRAHHFFVPESCNRPHRIGTPVSFGC